MIVVFPYHPVDRKMQHPHKGSLGVATMATLTPQLKSQEKILYKTDPNLNILIALV